MFVCTYVGEYIYKGSMDVYLYTGDLIMYEVYRGFTYVWEHTGVVIMYRNRDRSVCLFVTTIQL